MTTLRRTIEASTRFLFFTGKGGVGKTSHACATAVALADAGRRRAAGQHRPGLQPGGGARHRGGDRAPGGSGGGGALGDEHRPRGRGGGVPRAGGRARARTSPRRRDRADGGAALGRLHRGGRRLRRVRRAPGRPGAHRRVRARGLRHRARPGTRCGSSNSPPPGRASWSRTSAGPPAWDRFPARRSNASATRATVRALSDPAQHRGGPGRPARRRAR